MDPEAAAQSQGAESQGGPSDPEPSAPDPSGPESSAPDPGGPGLSDQDLAVLDIARRQWAGPGAKERAIREGLGLSPTRYYQLLNALLDDARALAHDPVTVNRLRRLRESRRAHR
jgi:hypothetical protein